MPQNDNMTCIVDGIYIVNTQAGFRKAVKHFNGPDGHDMREVDGYPTEYPALVALSRGYRGYLFTQVAVVSLDRLRTHITA